MIHINSETERMQEAINFAKRQIEDLDRKITECNYTEDVNGELVYSYNDYEEEKREYQHERLQWEIMLNILTDETPFTLLGW